MKKVQNIMKKNLLLILGLAFFVGCSPDPEITSEIESVDLTKIIDPDTVVADADFDYTSNGIYRGVFVSNDISYHGVLTVNLGNDSRYNAVLEYGDDRKLRIGFIRVNMGPTGETNLIEFRGKNAGFTLDVSDYSHPIFSEGYIDGQTAQAKLLKEKSANRVLVTLGTFSDDLDPTFFGTWDFLSSSTRVISIPTSVPNPAIPEYDVTVNNIDVIVLTKSSGAMFNDNVMEDFTAGFDCAFIPLNLPSGVNAPYSTGKQTVTVVPVPLITRDLDQLSALNQTSTFNAPLPEVATWSILYSKIVNMYYDENCNESPLGGTWYWKGRNGHLLIN
jgi:hypothetical protein